MILVRLAFLSALLPGCGDALFECTSSVLDACDDVQTCCDSTECYFEVDGKEFRCDGKECDEATARLRAFCSDP